MMHSSDVLCVTWSTDSELLASGDAKGVLKVCGVCCSCCLAWLCGKGVLRGVVWCVLLLLSSVALWQRSASRCGVCCSCCLSWLCGKGVLKGCGVHRGSVAKASRCGVVCGALVVYRGFVAKEGFEVWCGVWCSCCLAWLCGKGVLRGVAWCVVFTTTHFFYTPPQY